MKKNFLILSMAMILFGGMAFAEGMVFDPTEYQATITETKTLPSNNNIQSSTKAAQTYAQNVVSGQSSSFNNALYELDTAQVNMRNELLEYKSKFQEIDTQYKLIKEQRRVLDKQIKAIEKRIKEIERSKSQIRKTMI